MRKLIVDRATDLGGMFCSNGACSPRPRCWWADRHRRARRASDRAADGRDRVHGPVRHRHPAATVRVGHAVGRRDRPRHAARGLRRHRARRRVILAARPRRRRWRHAFRCCSSAAVRRSAQWSSSRRRCSLSVRASSSPMRCRRSRRRAARLQRHPRAAAVRRRELLARRIRVRLRARVLGRPRSGRRLVWPCPRACDLRRAPAGVSPCSSGADICRRPRRKMPRHAHDGAPVDRAPRPSRRWYRGRPAPRSTCPIRCRGKPSRSKTGPATPTAGDCCGWRPRTPTASPRSVRTLVSAAAARCSTGRGIAIAHGSATLWSPRLTPQDLQQRSMI